MELNLKTNEGLEFKLKSFTRTLGLSKKEILMVTVIFSLVFFQIYFVHIEAWAATPSAPIHLSAYPLSDKTIHLSWNASSNIVASYTIYRNYSSSIGPIPIALGLITPNYVDKDSNLTEGVRYSYTVTAKNVAGESSPSVTTYAIPYTPITSQNIIVSLTVSISVVVALVFIVYGIYRRAKKVEQKDLERKDKDQSTVIQSADTEDTFESNSRKEHDDIKNIWKFWNLIRGNDWYPSLSLFQLFLWSVVIVFSFLFVSIIMFQHGILPPVKSLNTPMLLALLGISVASPILGGTLSSAKYADLSATGPPPGKLPGFSTMFEEGGKPSLTRFQMFMWTWIGILIFFISMVNEVSNNLNTPSQLAVPDVDPVIVALMGMSQIAYLGGKAIFGTPSIGSIYPRVVNYAEIPTDGQIISIFGIGFGKDVPRGFVWIGSEYLEYPDNSKQDPKSEIMAWSDDRIDIKIPKILFPTPGLYYVRVASPGALVKYDKPFEVKSS